jgi:hypothetical protein
VKASYEKATQSAIRDGKLQQKLEEVDSLSPLVVEGAPERASQPSADQLTREDGNRSDQEDEGNGVMTALAISSGVAAAVVFMAVIYYLVITHRQNQGKDDAEGEDDFTVAEDELDDARAAESANEYREELEALIKAHCPDHLENLDSMLKQFKGREEVLIQTLRNIGDEDSEGDESSKDSDSLDSDLDSSPDPPDGQEERADNDDHGKAEGRDSLIEGLRNMAGRNNNSKHGISPDAPLGNASMNEDPSEEDDSQPREGGSLSQEGVVDGTGLDANPLESLDEATNGPEYGLSSQARREATLGQDEDGTIQEKGEPPQITWTRVGDRWHPAAETHACGDEDEEEEDDSAATENASSSVEDGDHAVAPHWLLKGKEWVDSFIYDNDDVVEEGAADEDGNLDGHKVVDYVGEGDANEDSSSEDTAAAGSDHGHQDLVEPDQQAALMHLREGEEETGMDASENKSIHSDVVEASQNDESGSESTVIQQGRLGDEETGNDHELDYSGEDKSEDPSQKSEDLSQEMDHENDFVDEQKMETEYTEDVCTGDNSNQNEESDTGSAVPGTAEEGEIEKGQQNLVSDTLSDQDAGGEEEGSEDDESVEDQKAVDNLTPVDTGTEDSDNEDTIIESNTFNTGEGEGVGATAAGDANASDNTSDREVQSDNVREEAGEEEEKLQEQDVGRETATPAEGGRHSSVEKDTADMDLASGESQSLNEEEPDVKSEVQESKEDQQKSGGPDAGSNTVCNAARDVDAAENDSESEDDSDEDEAEQIPPLPVKESETPKGLRKSVFDSDSDDDSDDSGNSSGSDSD